MAPVIRISDELFRRLQRYGEALVDTPSSVIEKVLDQLESATGSAPPVGMALPKQEDAVAAQSRDTTADRDRGLFLAPALSENLEATIKRGVQLDSLRDSLTDKEAKAIEVALGGSTELRCWAMTESRRGTYASMRRDDVVVFTEKGTGKFGYLGKVLGKIESQRLGERLWRETPNKPWKLIYFLGDVRRVNIPKSFLLNELGYDQNYVVPGIVRVSSSKLIAALRRFGTLENMLESAERSAA